MRTMGQVGFVKGQLISEMAEITGFKSGLSFSYQRMLGFVSAESKKILEKNYESVVGLCLEEYEEIYFDVLQGTGYAPKTTSPCMHLFSLTLKNMFADNKDKLEIGLKIYEEYGKWIKEEIDTLKNSDEKIISPEPYIKRCISKYGNLGYGIALQVLKSQSDYQKYSPWYQIRRVNWENKLDLEDLFKSESLKTYYGNFIDQRYIDYLSNHLDDVGEIHWRKFEGLTGEFFKKEGYEVTLGPGRNDGGIDIRVWKEKADRENPPMILIQCKRQKDKVKREIVKALWTDVLFEKAESGLIVTSSEVAMGAKEDCKIRGYNIDFAEKPTLQKWITSMRSKDIEIIV